LSVLALVPAAGEGVRLGAASPKALVPLGGVPLVEHAVRGLLDSGSVDHVVVAVRGKDVDEVLTLFAPESSPAAGPRRAVDVVAGGADRCSSVAAALWHGVRRYPEAHTVLVHDVDRALTPPAMMSRVVKAVAEGADSVVPVLALADTVKEVDQAGAVLGTADRSRLRVAQTPRAFRLELLCRAYRAAGYHPECSGLPLQVPLDEAGLVARLQQRVRTVPGDPLAFPIITPWDLRVAQMMLGSSAP
jgi:2-C-methyl-D-erythritol 4-phosphate cytidylyltransferase